MIAALAVFFQRIRHLMVIRHHHSHAQFLCPENGLSRGDPVVTGQNHAISLAVGLFHNPVIESVPFLHTIRCIDRRLSSDAQDSLQQNHTGKNSIHIKITADGDFYSISDRLFHQIRGLPHIFHPPRIIQILHRSIQIPAYRILPVHIPVSYNPGCHRTDVKCLCYPIKISLLSIYTPAFSHRFLSFVIFQ